MTQDKKLKLSPCYEGTWWSGGIAPQFLTSALYAGEWPASRPGRFTAGKIDPRTHWIGGVVDLRAGLDVVEKIKILLLPGFESRPCTPLYRLLRTVMLNTCEEESLRAVYELITGQGVWRIRMSQELRPLIPDLAAHIYHSPVGVVGGSD
jgi:hypothetical protein